MAIAGLSMEYQHIHARQQRKAVIAAIGAKYSIDKVLMAKFGNLTTSFSENLKFPEWSADLEWDLVQQSTGNAPHYALIVAYRETKADKNGVLKSIDRIVKLTPEQIIEALDDRWFWEK